jgi:hypothetical protein
MGQRLSAKSYDYACFNKNLFYMGETSMMRLIAFVVFALGITASAQAMPVAPIHERPAS